MLHKLKEIIYRRYRISFSGSGDDIQLFKLIGSSRPGVYLDIGCWDPIRHSNSYFFYLRGWRGICVDPNPSMQDKFNKFRPNDKFINKGVGSSSRETLDYYKLDDLKSDMNTFDKDFLTEQNLTNRIESVLKIEMTTLEEILDTNLKKNARLDFFDIDVEGFDLDVLKGNNWNKYRPKIVLVESHDSIIEDTTSQVKIFLESVDYKLVAKSMNHENSGNLFFVDLRI